MSIFRTENGVESVKMGSNTEGVVGGFAGLGCLWSLKDSNVATKSSKAVAVNFSMILLLFCL